MKVRRMLSGFWGVQYHGKLYSAFDSHVEALAFAVNVSDQELAIRAAQGKLEELDVARGRG